MGNKTKAAMLTMILSIGNSFIVTLFNLIYNQYIISIYGSQVNGLISTLTQFVSLFMIIEGGFTTAAVVATYDPVVKKDYDRLNDILFTTKKTYNKIGVLVAACVLMAGSVYIKYINSPFSYLQTYTLLVISVMTVISSLSILSKYSVLLQGNNKEYMLILFSLISRTVIWVLSIVLIVNNVWIILVYLLNLINVLLNSFLVHLYEKKNYQYATYKGIYDKKLISGTKDVLLQKIAGTVFTSTDLIIISVFINLASASVYNLYYQVFKAIYNLLSSVVQAPFHAFGQLVNTEEGNEKINDYFHIYQHLVLIVSTILLTITGEIIIPFVYVYTKNIHDYNYVYPILVVLFFSQIFAQILNRPFGTILNATGNFKMQNKQCMIAAVVNVLISVMFIRWWGIHSVVFGSFVGTLIILVMNIYQAYKYVLNQNAARVLFNISINYIIGLSCIFAALKAGTSPSSYIKWIWEALPFTIVTTLLIAGINIIIDYNSMKKVLKYMAFVIRRKQWR